MAADHDHHDDDPKPVFQGDWRTATGVEKGQHSEAVRQWKLRQGLPVGGRMGAQSTQPVPRNPSAAPPSDPTRAVLEGIRDDGNALASDRIRASQALIALDRGEHEAGAQDSDLVQLKAVLETLDPAERLAWLQGERAEHAAAMADA